MCALFFTAGSWRRTASRCAPWMAPGGTVAPPWCPAPPPPPTSPTWRRTRGSCGVESLMSGKRCARRRRSSSRWDQWKSTDLLKGPINSVILNITYSFIRSSGYRLQASLVMHFLQATKVLSVSLFTSSQCNCKGHLCPCWPCSAVILAADILKLILGCLFLHLVSEVLW